MSPFSYIKDYSSFGVLGIVVLLIYLFVITYFHYTIKGYKCFKSYYVFVVYIIFIVWLIFTFKISVSFANESWVVPFFISILCETIDYNRYKRFKQK